MNINQVEVQMPILVFPLVAKQYVRSYACKVEVLGLSLNEWVLYYITKRAKGARTVNPI